MSTLERKRDGRMSNGFYTTPEREEFVKKQKRERDRERQRTANRNRPFIAWDGEGFDVDGYHQYMLLVNSEGDMLEADDDSVISTNEAFQFMLDVAQDHRDAIHIAFGISYDVNMILNGIFRELPYKSLMRLVGTNKCIWMEYEIEYVPRRFFRIAQYDVRESDRDGHKVKGKLIRSISVWDVMQFFQMKFVDALRGMFKEEEMGEYFDMELIESQKARRGEFTMEDLESGLLADYSLNEVNALVELMVRFRKNCHDSGIHLNRYDGAGAGAAALMREHGIGQMIKVANGIMEADVNKGLNDAVNVAYGSGHVEMYMSGHTDKKVYHYDIRGSFPSKTRYLPDLSQGIWNNCKFSDEFEWLPIFPVEDFTVYKVYWDYREEFSRMFPFFYRSPWGSPRISYPPQGYTWVWSPELRAAMSFVAMRHLNVFPKVVEMWKFTPYTNNRPFDFIDEVYDKRLWYKKQGLHGQEVGIKGSLNAIPGKMAQTINYRDKDTKPPYFNLAYAGFITSGVRAQVFEAMMQAPYDIIALATDGIWSMVPLDLPISERLGDWKYEELDGFTSVQPGIYFTHRSKDEKGVHHYRGFSSDSISEADVIEAWKQRAYSIPVKTKRFIGMASLTSREEYRHKWCTWVNEERMLSLQEGMSTKRMPILLEGEDWPTSRSAYELIESDASPVPQFEDNVPSYATEDKWGVSIETYLSRPYHALRDTGVLEEVVDHSVDWEIIESEI